MSFQHFSFYCRNFMLIAFASAVVITMAGCGQQQLPFEAKSSEKPKPVHCFDAVGHMPGTKPFIFGGTCCCTPSPELMEQYHRDGFLQDMEYEDLVRAYNERGIQLASVSHNACNNLCEHGPHVTKGGKCMVSPTPGTVNFEEVRFGLRYMTSEAAKSFIKEEKQ